MAAPLSGSVIQAEIIAVFGRQLLVQPISSKPTEEPVGSDTLKSCPGDELAEPGVEGVPAPRQAPIEAVTRGRRSDGCVGDLVRLTLLNDRQGVIESIAERRNVVSRSDGFRTKTLASNLDQAMIVISGDPPYDESLLMRVLVTLQVQAIPAIIVATKSDLSAAFTRIRSRLELYRSLGHEVIESRIEPGSDGLAPETAERFRSVLAGARTLLLGQSGMGKSTLLNVLIPDADQRTRAISEALRTGRHTTTFCRAFTLPARAGLKRGGPGSLIDTPGFAQFGIAHLGAWQIAHGIPEVASRLGHCRFNNCVHDSNAAGCAVRDAVDQGQMDPLRYRLFMGMARDAAR